MGGSCCKSSGDNIEIKFSQTNTNRIRYNNNNIKLNITGSSGYPIKMNVNPNWPFSEIKKKYCILIGKTDINKLIFVYKGKVMEIGDDEHGYIMVPADSYKYYDNTATNLIQYCDDTPANIITIKHLPGVDSYTAAQGLMAGIDQEGIAEGLTGATVKLGNYDAYQIYGLYPDGVYEVIWVTQDKNDPDNSYYISFELDAEHIDDLALASTYKMPADHK
jgi:hypothetical protein